MIDTLVQRLIAREGGYVDHPADKGGPTNMGITQETLSHWRGYPCHEEDVKDLQESEVHSIYQFQYWLEPSIDTLKTSPQLREMIFDASVHHGPKTAVKLLQRASGVEDDGIIGPQTQIAVIDLDPCDLAARFMAERVVFFGSLITRSPDQAVFAHGWMRRVAEFIVMIPGA